MSTQGWEIANRMNKISEILYLFIVLVGFVISMYFAWPCSNL